MPVLLSYKNQSIDLHSKSIDWFLHRAALALNGLNQSIRERKTIQMDENSFIINIKTNLYEDIPNDVEKRFDTSNYEVKRPLPK